MTEPKYVYPNKEPLLTREAVLEKLIPANKIQMRHIADASETRVKIDENTLVIQPSKGARSIEVETKEGLPNMLRVVGLPLNIASMLSPGTFSACLTEMLQKKDHFSLVVQDDKITDMVKYKERQNFQPEKMLSVIEKQIPVRGYRRLMPLGHLGFQLETVGEKVEHVVPGDLVSGGVLIKFSPLNIINPEVQAYAERGVCANGLASMEYLQSFGGGRGGGEGDDIWQWFRNNVKRAYGALGGLVNEWRRLVDEKISPAERAAALEALIKEARLPPEVANNLRAMAMENPLENNWDLHNLITYASSHLLNEPREITRAQKTSAEFAARDTHARICPVCHNSQQITRGASHPENN